MHASSTLHQQCGTISPHNIKQYDPMSAHAGHPTHWHLYERECECRVGNHATDAHPQQPLCICVAGLLLQQLRHDLHRPCFQVLLQTDTSTQWLSVCLPCQVSPCHVGQDADGQGNSAAPVLAWRQGSHTDACVLWWPTENLPRWPSCAAWCRAGARSPSCCTPTATSGGPPTCGLTPPSRRACTVAQQSPQSRLAAAHTAPLPYVKPVITRSVLRMKSLCTMPLRPFVRC
jgi:hypothetical protein